MPTSREPHRRPGGKKRNVHKAHLLFSSKPNAIEQLTDLLNSLTALLRASASLGSIGLQLLTASAVFGSIVVGHQEPAGPSISEHCLFINDKDSLVGAANELLWRANPELNRRHQTRRTRLRGQSVR